MHLSLLVQKLVRASQGAQSLVWSLPVVLGLVNYVSKAVSCRWTQRVALRLVLRSGPAGAGFLVFRRLVGRQGEIIHR
jgi:hypothetical protein